MRSDDFLRTLGLILGSNAWPKPLHVLQGLELIKAGERLEDAAREVRTSRPRLRRAHDAADPFADVLGEALPPNSVLVNDRASKLGTLVLGRSAELVFEELYRREMPDTEFNLVDLREGRTDTDYRMYNGQGRPVYRINIKFHGARFRRASDLVSLDPEDCFALATYKIDSAMKKQNDEQLPYFFAVVGVSNLTGVAVGERIPRDVTEAVSFLGRAPRGPSIRRMEDAAVEHLVRSNATVVTTTMGEIREADWHMLSARRADKLVREKLFERVFALRVPSFARAFRGAELDMHFSLSEDLTPLPDFLTALRERGPQAVSTILERGDY
ncbi:MAG: hypothetical protein OXG95_02260 [Chloroflexi bacterium]|nr:hypothetical protein [Chloroflexota bacterium]